MSSTPPPGPGPVAPLPGDVTTSPEAIPPAVPPEAAPEPPPAPSPSVVWESPEVAAGPAPGIEFAPHGARLVAYILDGIIIGILVGIFVAFGSGILFSGATYEGDRVVSITTSAALIATVFFVIGGAIGLLYFPFFWATGGSTLGMRPFNLRVVRDRDGGVRLAGRRKRLLDTAVQLVCTRPVAQAEPHPSAGREHRRLRDLGQPDQLAVERPQRVLTARRARDLHVVEADDTHAPRPSGRWATRKMRRNGKITPIGVLGYAARSLAS